MGVLATKPGNDTVIYSLDKDLMQIPGKHLVDGKIVVVTEEEGDYLHMMQTLTGDPTDGYKGCPGMGKVSAARLLDSVGTKGCEESPDCWCMGNCKNKDRTQWEAIVKAFERAGQTEADALKQARLARILRWSDWDQQKQQVVLWTPDRRQEV
jgi:DNA polymerase-1